MTWYPETEDFLVNQEYEQLVDFYENLIGENPAEITNYWYLGLAYLLQGLEEEANLTWLTALSEISPEEIDNYTQDLVEVLNQEVTRQLRINNLQNAWLIRSHIRELSPDNYDNLLELICLDIQLNNYNIDQFETWHLSELCQSLSPDIFPTDLLIKTLNLILSLPCPDSLAFARFCLSKDQDFEILVATVINFAVKIGYSYPQYAIDLLNICLEIQPDYSNREDILPNILNGIYVFFNEREDYDNALKTSYKFLEQSTNLGMRIFGNYQLIYTYVKSQEWDKLGAVFAEQKQCLNQFIKQPEEIKINFIRQSWLLINQPLLYIQDNPQENRYFINHISKSFQSFCREDNFCPPTPNSGGVREGKVLKIGDLGAVCPPTPNSGGVREGKVPKIGDLGASKVPNLDRPLKIGYIAHTLKAHSVGWLSRWLIHYHDQNQYPCYLYNMKNFADEVTINWFQKKVKGFYRFNQDVKGAVAQIQQDEIDILVDLDSFTLDLTCQVMALKPAPIQVTWLGMDASGIPAIDYFIADPYVLPDNGQDYYSEKIWRLPHTYLGIDGFEVDVPNLSREDLELSTDAVVYLNIQNALKRNPIAIHQQMKIIKAVPNSYFLIKGNGDQQRLKQLFTSIAEQEGVELDRLRFLPQTPTEAVHRANISLADVVLDTYPYNGATTTLETLWMEVPIVTRVGEQFAARNSYTFMVNAGITEGIAWTDEEYIQWGIKLGTDENLRKEVSWKLRQSKKTSPLWNGRQFAREMENAYREMWEIYVNS
jgi:predicted O-linked N-acetylglucosamine transferase (SPINDLY family)